MIKRLYLYTSILILIFTACDKSAGPDRPDPKPTCGIIIDDQPVWSPDGTTIAYYHQGISEIASDSCTIIDIDWSQEGIWLMNPDGSNKRMLVQGGEYPAWAPDSRRIVFERGGAIWKIKTDGDSLTRLTFRRVFWRPDVSPDNDKIAIYNTLTDSAGVWITDSGGNDSLSYWGVAGSPRWHPSGDSLLYGIGGDGYYIEALDHSHRRKIFNALGNPVEKMDINSFTNQIITASEGNIYRFNADGTGLRLVLSDIGASPSWAPDGSKIVFVSLKDNRFITIWIMNIDGNDKRPITFPPDIN